MNSNAHPANQNTLNKILHFFVRWTCVMVCVTGPYSPRDKGDLTKKFDQVRVWYRWKGYLSGSMEN